MEIILLIIAIVVGIPLVIMVIAGIGGFIEGLLDYIDHCILYIISKKYRTECNENTKREHENAKSAKIKADREAEARINYSSGGTWD